VQCGVPRPAQTQQLHGLQPDARHLRQAVRQGHAQRVHAGPRHPDGRGQPRTPLHQDRRHGGGRRGVLRGQPPLFVSVLQTLTGGGRIAVCPG